MAVRKVAGLEHVEKEDRQRAFGDDRRIELADRASGSVAGIREGVLATFDALAVVRLKGVFGHVDLAPHSEEVGIVAVESLRDGADGTRIGCHVVAFEPVTAGDRALESAVLVDELHGDAVELVFADVRDGPDLTLDTVVERSNVLGLTTRVDRQHRRDVFDRLERLEWFATDA